MKLSLCGATALTHDAVSALLRLPVLTELDIGGCCRITAMDKMRLVAKVRLSGGAPGVLRGRDAHQAAAAAVLQCMALLRCLCGGGADHACIHYSCFAMQVSAICCSRPDTFVPCLVLLQVKAGREMLESGRRPQVRMNSRFPGLLL
mgnify:CR=1 FL=1